MHKYIKQAAYYIYAERYPLQLERRTPVFPKKQKKETYISICVSIAITSHVHYVFRYPNLWPVNSSLTRPRSQHTLHNIC